MTFLPMTQGEALATALFATMALMLASRTVGSFRMSFKAKAMMAAVWLVLIAVSAVIAAQWLHHLT